MPAALMSLAQLRAAAKAARTAPVDAAFKQRHGKAVAVPALVAEPYLAALNDSNHPPTATLAARPAPATVTPTVKGAAPGANTRAPAVANNTAKTAVAGTTTARTSAAANNTARPTTTTARTTAPTTTARPAVNNTARPVAGATNTSRPAATNTTTTAAKRTAPTGTPAVPAANSRGPPKLPGQR